MIVIKQVGNFKRTTSYLQRLKKIKVYDILNQYGAIGVRELANATPKDSGETANAWVYEIVSSKGRYKLVWKNTNKVNGVPVVILLQYGHGTGTGGYVQGRDFINPVIQPIMDRIASDITKEVNAA